MLYCIFVTLYVLDRIKKEKEMDRKRRQRIHGEDAKEWVQRKTIELQRGEIDWGPEQINCIETGQKIGYYWPKEKIFMALGEIEEEG